MHKLVMYGLNNNKKNNNLVLVRKREWLQRWLEEKHK